MKEYLIEKSDVEFEAEKRKLWLQLANTVNDLPESRRMETIRCIRRLHALHIGETKSLFSTVLYLDVVATEMRQHGSRMFRFLARALELCAEHNVPNLRPFGQSVAEYLEAWKTWQPPTDEQIQKKYSDMKTEYRNRQKAHSS